MSRKLKLFNGRAHGEWMRGGHFYVAAYSQKDAAEMLLELCGGRGWAHEISVYYSHGCWGDVMKGITPERGIWVTTAPRDVPQRVYPK